MKEENDCAPNLIDLIVANVIFAYTIVQKWTHVAAMCIL